MYSTHNEERSLVAEKFITTLKSNIYKHMKSVSKMCILQIEWYNKGIQEYIS